MKHFEECGHKRKHVNVGATLIGDCLNNNMNEIFEYAYAKLNISLDIVSKMDDGYHDMLMIMQSVSLCDDISISRCAGTGKISVVTNKSYLPEDENNLAGVAAACFMKAADIRDWNIDIKIKKRIPVCAGLGGGSGDAAAVLRGMNTLFNVGFSGETLEKIGFSVGSDVPFCVAGGTRLAKGRGEILSDVCPLPECFIVICKPDFSVSTPMLFSKIDLKHVKVRPDTNGIVEALSTGDLKSVCHRMYNIFEDVLPSGKSEVEKLKGTLYDNGALGTIMSGTGSAVFGVFKCREKAEKAFDELKVRYKDVFLATPTEKINV